jgi:VanZ family protein
MFHPRLNTNTSQTGAFLFLAATAAYAGLSSLQVDSHINDKVLHFLTFFVLTTCFYWILDTSRRRSLNFTLVTCTGLLGVGSEFLQGFLPNGRTFDFYDIVANVVGSLLGLGLSSWYHQRMIERKKRNKQSYQPVPGEEGDVELGEGVGPQEEGVVSRTEQTLDEAVDNWDENVEDDWDAEGEHTDEGDGPKTPSASSGGEEADAKKRAG